MICKKPQCNVLKTQTLTKRVPKNQNFRSINNNVKQEQKEHSKSFSSFKISRPKFSRPNISVPKVSLPGINISSVKLPKFELPALNFSFVWEFFNKIPISQFVTVIGSLISKIYSTILGSLRPCLNKLGSGSIAICGILFICSSFISSNFYKSVKWIVRLFYVLTCRWMKIHGSHGVPNLGIRRLRMVTVMSIMGFLSVGVALRLYALQNTQHLKWDKIAHKQHGTGVNVQGARGVILDRNGLQLAVSIPALSIGIHPKWIKNKEDASLKLANILEMPKAEVLAKLNEDKNYTILTKGISTSKKQSLDHLKLYGLEVQEEFNRVYPQGDLASTIIGKAGKDGVGLSGVERALDSSLNAPSTKFAAQRDARGRLMNSAVWQNLEEEQSILKKASFSQSSHFLVGDQLRKEGSNVSLTIDSVIQRVVEEEFDKAKETAQAKNVFGVMMDADSGEILAMGQTTRYNPNANTNISNEALRNVVLQNSFEPGSTFKPIVAAIALDKGLTSRLEMIDCENGKYFIGRRMIRDAHPIPTVTFEQVLARSSNIGMAKLGFRLGKENLYDSLHEFGFGKKTGLDLAGESTGIMRHSKKWAQIDIATHSFGQGVSVTALQMVRAYSVLANGGKLLEPTILKSKVGKSEGTQLISEKTAQVIKDALYLVTEDEHGTGKNSRIAGVPVYGKTGTAQKAKENGRGYDPDKILASFIGFVDGRVIGVDKTLVFFVAVDEPGVKPRWGGTLAAPVFKQVVERTLSHLLSQKAFESRDPQYVKLDKTSLFPKS